MVKQGVLEAPLVTAIRRSPGWLARMSPIAAAVLLQPDQYVGGTRYVTGPEALTFRQVADIASAAFGKLIRYNNGISIEAWARRLREHRLANDRLVKHASVLAYAFGKTKLSFGLATDKVLSATGCGTHDPEGVSVAQSLGIWCVGRRSPLAAGEDPACCVRTRTRSRK